MGSLTAVARADTASEQLKNQHDTCNNYSVQCQPDRHGGPVAFAGLSAHSTIAINRIWPTLSGCQSM